MNLVDLETFARVVETGSLTRAARSLGVPKSTVSRRVSRLEDAIGLALLVRSGRSVKVTDHGERLHARTADALRRIADVERELGEASLEPAGRLRVTAPQDLGHTLRFGELVATYRARFPKVSFELELTNRVVDLAHEGFDLAFRPNAADHPASGLVARRLFTMAGKLFASPGYLARRGRPETPADLAGHDAVLHTVQRGAGGFALRRDGGAAAPEPLASMNAAVLVNDFAVVAAVAMNGGGIGGLPQPYAKPFVAAGRLEPVLPEWSGFEGQLWLVWPETRHLAPAVRAFVDHVVAELEADRWAEAPP